MTDRQATPAFRHSPERELIPAAMLRAMAGLVIAALALATFAVLTGREPEGQPPAAPIAAERVLILEGLGAKAVRVRTPDGEVVADLAHGGFVTVVQNALGYERAKHGVPADRPVRLVAYENGRLAIHDPETGWSAELGNFGDANRAAFERLMQD